MKLNMFAYLYSKPLGNHTLKIMKKYLEIYYKTWKNHGNIMEFCQSEKVGTLNVDIHTNYMRAVDLSCFALMTCRFKYIFDFFFHFGNYL